MLGGSFLGAIIEKASSSMNEELKHEVKEERKKTLLFGKRKRVG